jgi:DNA-binding SARP family transcriptional activator
VSERLPPGEGSRSRAPQPSGPRLDVCLFGGISLRLADREIAVTNRKARALLGYLALAPNLSETRERLVGMLWSDSDEARARGSLRQLLHGLRDQLDQEGFGGLAADRNEVALAPRSISVDIAAVLDSVDAGSPHELLLDRQCLADTLMAGYEDIDESFRNWLMVKRQSLHNKIAHTLESALRDGSAARVGIYDRTARALLNLDPTHEEAARALIRARADAGDIGAALGIYKALWDLLENEYGMEPSMPTQDLIADIKLAQPLDKARAVVASGPRSVVARPLPSASAKLSSAPKLVVSVAEFDATATKEEQRYLVHGFRLELIACLVRFREWLVCDRMSTSAESLEPDDAAAEFIIEASAFQVGDEVRMVLMLREAATNTYLWSERFQISMAKWFEAQQAVVRRLAIALNVNLSAERMATIPSRPTNNLRANDLWLLGQAAVLNVDPINWERARNLFREVIDQMPDFAPAYSSLAQLNNAYHLAIPGIFRDRARTEEALACAREAARLDPIDSRSQLCLGWSHAMAMQYEQAVIFISLAYELNENDPWTLVSSAGCFAVCGETDRAREIAAHALRLPLAPSPLQWAYHVSIRFLAGDYEGAVRAAMAAGDVSYVPGYKAAALYHLGERAAAAAELQRYADLIRSRWVGEHPATDPNIMRWLLTMIPIKRPEDWQRVRDGLVGAGACVDGLTHDGW